MLVIGLTGGIGSGKSTVAEIFSSYGIPIIDADVIAHQLVEPQQPALDKIVIEFGEEILDSEGKLNRDSLREIVFHNTESRKKLEAILHPLILEEMSKQVEQETSSPYCIMVIPLLVDTGHWELIDKVLVVDVDENTQIERVQKRDHFNREQVLAILDAQVSRQERLDAADDVIINNGNIEDLEISINELHQRYLSSSSEEEITEETSNNKESKTQIEEFAYEQPLNERIRIFLRLEELFKRVSYHLKSNSKWDLHALIGSMIEVTSLMSRGDIKGEIIKELERQQTSLKRHHSMPNVNQIRLTSLLDELQSLLNKLYAIDHKIGHHMNSDTLFNNVRQRYTIPGGTCGFDIPYYAYWLNLTPEKRELTLENWLAPFDIINQAISICLNNIRNTTNPEIKTAENGFYQQAIENSQNSQLIRVIPLKYGNAYPEISAGKHRFSVRFYELSNSMDRPRQSSEDIEFKLMSCGL